MDDPTAVVRVDEIANVAPAQGQNQPGPSGTADNSENEMDVDRKNVTMVVLDGIVMGPTVSLFIKIKLYN